VERQSEFQSLVCKASCPVDVESAAAMLSRHPRIAIFDNMSSVVKNLEDPTLLITELGHPALVAFGGVLAHGTERKP
jgi:hypothetical protein